MKRILIVASVCSLFSSVARAGHEYSAKPGEEVATRQYIVKLRPGVAPSTVLPGLVPGADPVALRVPDSYLVHIPQGTPTSVTSQLAAHALVDFVEPNRIRHTMIQSPNDPQSASQWALQAVQAAQAWGLIPAQYLTAASAGSGTNRVRVAILDTGIDCTHPDFVNSGGSSRDAANGGQLSFSASQAPTATTIASPACSWQDDFGHGTHVAGIVAASANNATGVAGLAFPVELMAFKVLDSTGSGSDVTIANAIIAATNAGARVVSLSLGGAGYSQTLQLAANYAWQHNTLVVAAAGNSSSNALFFPAGANFVVGVSATDSSGSMASFSNFGNGVDIAAPGVSILSTLPTYANPLGGVNYGSLSGTSMATPHVSALAGLLAMTTPNASAASILQRIQQSAVSSTVNGGWNQNLGYGVINAFNAVSGAARTATIGGLVGQITDSSANPISGGQIVVNGQVITVDSSGLYRFPSLPAGNYSVSVTASGFAAQNLTATVAPGADTTLPVVMGVTYGRFTGTVSDLGIPVADSIVQAVSGGLIAATAVTDSNGQYSLWVPGGGTYSLVVSALSKSTTTATGQSVAAGGTSTVNLAITKLGTISGVVTDTSLRAIGGAQILISNTTFSTAATTDTNGGYSTIALPLGSYTVTSSASGFQNVTINNVASSADAVTALNIQLPAVTSGTVAAPTFSPGAGTYGTAQTVSISSTTAGASIRYTTDGVTTPTQTVGTLFAGPITVSSTTTIKAIAYASGMADSAVTSASYTITVTTGGPAWYGAAWTSRKPVTISHAKVSTTLANFPMLFSVTDANLKSLAKSDGSDILFTASDGVTKLNHEIESYNSATGQLVAWVRIPALSSTLDTVIYAYYGNASASSQQNPTSVWDSNYRGVYHLKETLTAGGQTVADSTANAFHGTSQGTWSASQQTAGQIGGGLSFDGSTDSVNLWKLAFSGGTYTVSFWANPNSGNYYIFDSSGSQRLVVDLGTYTTDRTLGISDNNAWYSLSSPFTLNQWMYFTVVMDSGSGALTGYVNGALAGTKPYTTTIASNYASQNLGSANGGGYSFFTGKLDEFRLSTAARPAGWIATEFNNQSSPSTFFTIGAQEGSGTTLQQVVAPAFSLAPGTYSAAQTVSLSSTTAGASIRYTTDGVTTPTQTVGTLFAGPITVSSTTTIKAIAYKTGMTDSSVSSGVFTIAISVPPPTPAVAPTFNPAGGTYSAAQSVTISSATAGASIRYTTDGVTVPTETVGTLYNNAAIAVSSNTTIKAIAYKTGLADSAVSSAAYTITLSTAVNTATFVKTDAGTQGSWKGVYGANGYNVIDDTTAYPSYVTVTPFGQANYIWTNSTPEVRGLQKASSATDRIAAVWYNGTPFSIDLNFNDSAQHQIALYVLDWDGNNSRAETINILDGVTNAVLDSRAATSFSNGQYLIWKLTGHVIVRITSIGAINAVLDGLFFDTPSAGLSSAAAPTFTPGTGTFTSAQQVTISSTTTGATIRYTTDGVTTPTETVGTVYSGPVMVSSTKTIKAIAYKSGMNDSTVASCVLTITIATPAATPTFTPGTGTFTSAQQVTISSTTTGATIRYTTDGVTTPTETVGTVYGGPLTVSSSKTIKAIAYKSGMNDSPVASCVLTITTATPAAAPTFSLAAGTYASAQQVIISSATSGASIRYTTDGVTTPTETVGTLYSGVITVGSSTTIKAIAYKTGLADSTVSSVAYTISLPVVTHSVTLNWAASASPTVTGYKVYRSLISGGPYALLTTSLVNGTSYTDTTVLGGLTYYYVVTAVDSSSLESGYSPQVQAVVPLP